jgi:hypothetical protein
MARFDLLCADAGDVTNDMECFMCVGEKYRCNSQHSLFLHIVCTHSDIKLEELVGSLRMQKTLEEGIKDGALSCGSTPEDVRMFFTTVAKSSGPNCR